MKETIVILSHVAFDNSPYCSYTHNHAKELVKKGYKVIVFAMINWFPIISKFQKNKTQFMDRIKINKRKRVVIDGVEIIYKKLISFSNLLYHSPINLNGISYYNSIKKEFKKIYQDNKIVLIDAHTFKQEGYAAYRLKKRYPNIFTTVTLHGTSFSKNTITKSGIKAIKKVFSYVDYAICVSHKLENMLRKLEVYNTRVILNGTNKYDIMIKDKDKFKYNIVTLGSLDFWKKHDVIIQAIGSLISKYPLLQLTIIGNGQDKEKLESLAKDLKIERKINFISNIENKQVLEIMNESNIFALLSINEGFGIAYVEAMSVGCITIGTKKEGIDGFIKDKENGFLLNSNSEELVSLIDNIYQGKYNLDDIRENAIRDAKELTWEKNAEQYVELLKGRV